MNRSALRSLDAHPLALALTVVALGAFVLSLIRGTHRPLPAIAMDWPLLLHVERAVVVAGLVGAIGVVWLRISRGELPTRIGPTGAEWAGTDAPARDLNEQLLRVDREAKAAIEELTGVVLDLMDQVPATPERERIERQLSRLDDALGDAERADKIADAIASLPEREKLVVALFYYENLTTSEIAEVLGTPETQIASLRGSALRQLTERLGENPFPPSDES